MVACKNTDHNQLLINLTHFLLNHLNILNLILSIIQNCLHRGYNNYELSDLAHNHPALSRVVIALSMNPHLSYSLNAFAFDHSQLDHSPYYTKIEDLQLPSRILTAEDNLYSNRELSALKFIKSVLARPTMPLSILAFSYQINQINNTATEVAHLFAPANVPPSIALRELREGARERLSKLN